MPYRPPADLRALCGALRPLVKQGVDGVTLIDLPGITPDIIHTFAQKGITSLRQYIGFTLTHHERGAVEWQWPTLIWSYIHQMADADSSRLAWALVYLAKAWLGGAAPPSPGSQADDEEEDDGADDEGAGGGGAPAALPLPAPTPRADMDTDAHPWPDLLRQLCARYPGLSRASPHEAIMGLARALPAGTSAAFCGIPVPAATVARARTFLLEWGALEGMLAGPVKAGMLRGEEPPKGVGQYRDAASHGCSPLFLAAAAALRRRVVVSFGGCGVNYDCRRGAPAAGAPAVCVELEKRVWTVG